jgi:hypothetical protein
MKELLQKIIDHQKLQPMLTRFLLSFIIVSFSVSSCNSPVKGKNGVIYKSAVEYNDFIVSRQTKLIRNVLEFSKAAEVNTDSAQQKLNTYVNQAEEMINEIKGMPPYKGDSLLRDAAISSFAFYKKVFDKDYREILDIKRKGDENITTEDAERANAIIERITKEEESYDKRFHEAQKSYAQKNNMKLIDNKMQQEIDKYKGN